MTLMCGEKWLETGNPFVEGDMSESKEQWLIAENERLTKENEQLVRDMHRIDSARQSAISQCAALAAQIEVLTDAINEVRP
ncbi:MAG TPA: hypothetical protein PLN40_14885 [Agitococcus sp.]|nr:hypothetical protein [Agitococcus sp.]